MAQKETEQIGFSAVLFDTLFGLVLFFNIDSFLDIKNPAHFIFYLFTTLLLVHWWLIFKSADDALGAEVENSAMDLLFGLAYLILIEFIILSAKIFDYQGASYFLLALLIVDIIWALVWRYVGEWISKDHEKIVCMEQELEHIILIDLFCLLLFFLMLFVFMPYLGLVQFVLLFIFNYFIYIILTFVYKIIDIKIF